MLCMPRITQSEHAQAIQRIAELTAATEKIQADLLTAQAQLAKLETELREREDRAQAELHERDEALAREQGEWAETKMALEQELEEERALANDLRAELAVSRDAREDAQRAYFCVVATLLGGFFTAFSVVSALRCDLGPEL